MVQGSCIGSLLFTVYINDVYKIFDADTKCKLYADDVKFYSEIVTDDDHTRLQENLDALTRWSTDRQLTISAQKCFILYLGTQITSSYTLNDAVIHAPAVVKDLGVTIDKDLIFSTHTNSIAHRAHYRAYAINKCFVSRDRSTLLPAFTTYVRPLLESHHLSGSRNLSVL